MELPPGWQTDGSMYHGLSLSLVTARGRSTAEVVAWLPAAKSDRTDFFGEPVPLFRVRYVDGATPGFEVDLELSEVRDSLTEASRAKLGMPALAPAPAAPPISPLSAALAPAVAPAVAPPVAPAWPAPPPPPPPATTTDDCRACRGAHSKHTCGKARGPPSSPRPAPPPDAKPKMKKQSGYIYHNAQQRDAARAAVEAEAPELSTQEKSQAVMKKLADMWNALDDAAKQKYSEDAPLVEVKERKKPAAAAPAVQAVTAAPAEEVEPPATMEGLDLPSKPTDWPKELGQALRAARVPCAFVAPNPKRARGNTSNSVLDYDHYMTATTVDEFFSRKGNWGHLKYDVQSWSGVLDCIASMAWRLNRNAIAAARDTRVASTASSVPHAGGATARSTRRN